MRNLMTLTCGLLGFWSAVACLEAGEIQITKAGQPQISIVLLAEKSDWLTTRAAENLRSVIHDWTGANVKVVSTLTSLPPGTLLVLAEAGSAGRLPSNTDKQAFELVQMVSDGGFACQAGQMEGRQAYFVVGKTNRGLYNGAQYVRDFLLDGPKENLKLDARKVLRSPRSGGRPVYLLTIWGNEAEYTAADWEKCFDSFARDGFDRVYFWLSGHFPSKKYPQTYRVKDDKWDTTEKSRIGTIEDQRRLIRSAHERGLKFYLGGALGGWVGTRFLTNQEPGTMKTALPGAQYEGKYSLCPSHPKSRKALIEYYTEMFDALPEADGVFIESADEWGGCGCESCSKPVDEAGSTYFGQAQLSLLQEIAASIWVRHPHARISYTIGYDEHRNDPAYYSVIRQMRDPRFEWMEARNSWSFPSYYGKDLPAAYFTPKVMRWQQYYRRPLRQLVEDAARTSTEGWYGLITAFEPGASGDFYTQIPYPTDIIPHIVTHFVLREANWDPPMTTEQMLDRVYARFCGREAPRQLAQAVWELRETMVEAPSAQSQGQAFEPSTHVQHSKEELLRRLSEIEQVVNQAAANASPKTMETLRLMRKAIADTRRHLGR
ncbi:MAG TPA: hypothetical protein PLP42_03025 [Acidobacteriota bacterium]|nr:hypothetical protein [Acidobacteriota bacterium]